MNQDGLGLKIDIDWKLEKFEGQKVEGDGKKPLEVIKGGFDPTGYEKPTTVQFADSKEQILLASEKVGQLRKMLQEANPDDRSAIVDKFIHQLKKEHSSKEEGG